MTAPDHTALDQAQAAQAAAATAYEQAVAAGATAAASALADAQTQLTAAQQALQAELAKETADEAQIAQQAATIATQASVIAEQEAEIAKLSGYSIGVAGSGIPTLMASVPQIKMVRVYAPGELPAAWNAALIPAGVTPFYSFKPNVPNMLAGKSDAAAVAFLKTYPKGGYLTAWHEPEQGGGAGRVPAAQHDQLMNYLADLAHTKAGRPDIQVGPVYQDYQLRYQKLHNVAYAWGKTVDWSKMNFAGTDLYAGNDASTKRAPGDTIEQAMTAYTMPYFDSIGVPATMPVMVGEIGSPVGYPSRGPWLAVGVKWGKTYSRPVTFCYFNENPTATARWLLAAQDWADFTADLS